MGDLNLPYHLIIPTGCAILLLGLLVWNRKMVFKDGMRKWFWISVMVFLSVYILIVVGSIYLGISSELALQKFDLDGDGFFSGKEITAQQKETVQLSVST